VAALLVVPGAVAAEWVGATGGLGQQLLIYNNDGRAVLSYACVMLLALLGLALWLVVLAVDAGLTRRGLLGVQTRA
jgi:ABC-type nitrate/sulfonate/bicarbonate transport system permease component